MVTENGKIIEISESELFSLYLERGIDEIMSFPDYKTRFVAVGCIVHDDLEAADCVADACPLTISGIDLVDEDGDPV